VKPILHFLRSDEAATSVEYAVMLSLIVLVALSGIALLGSETSAKWADIDTKLTDAGLGR
jgi:Flp pilus assembly pilin Flp